MVHLRRSSLAGVVCELVALLCMAVAGNIYSLHAAGVSESILACIGIWILAVVGPKKAT